MPKTLLEFRASSRDLRPSPLSTQQRFVMRTVSGGKRPRLTIVAVAVGAALALSACSSSGSSSPTSTAASSNGGTSGGGTSGAGGGSSATSRLASLSKTLDHAQGSSFQATYSADYNGQPQSLTIAQIPPKSLFKVADAVIIDTGSSTYYCPTTPNPTCVNTSEENPVSGLVNAFSPNAALGQLQAAQAAVASKVAGHDVTFSSATFAGQPSSCVATEAASASWKYCVTDAGQLAYASSGPQQVFQMTSFTSSVSPSIFVLPSGATVMTVPSS
jgi:hypothetical protein